MSVKSNNYLLLFFITLVTFASSCNPKPKDEVTEEPKQPITSVDCELWKSNQTFINASYVNFRNDNNGHVYVNKLSILQLIESLKLDSDPGLKERQTKLVQMLNSVVPDANNEILFQPEAIALRDQLANIIGEYVQKCNPNG